MRCSSSGSRGGRPLGFDAEHYKHALIYRGVLAILSRRFMARPWRRCTHRESGTVTCRMTWPHSRWPTMRLTGTALGRGGTDGRGEAEPVCHQLTPSSMARTRRWSTLRARSNGVNIGDTEKVG